MGANREERPKSEGHVAKRYALLDAKSSSSGTRFRAGNGSFAWFKGRSAVDVCFHSFAQKHVQWLEVTIVRSNRRIKPSLFTDLSLLLAMLKVISAFYTRKSATLY